MNLKFKFTSRIHPHLCIRHGVQEAMRGEDLEITMYDGDAPEIQCALCTMEGHVQNGAINEWYEEYRKGK